MKESFIWASLCLLETSKLIETIFYGVTRKIQGKPCGWTVEWHNFTLVPECIINVCIQCTYLVFVSLQETRRGCEKEETGREETADVHKDSGSKSAVWGQAAWSEGVVQVGTARHSQTVTVIVATHCNRQWSLPNMPLLPIYQQIMAIYRGGLWWEGELNAFVANFGHIIGGGIWWERSLRERPL